MPGMPAERFTATIGPLQSVSDDLIIDWNGWFEPSAVTKREPIQLPEAEIIQAASSGIDQLYGFLLQQPSAETEPAQTPQDRHSSRRLGSNALSVGDLIERPSSPVPTEEAEATMTIETPRESRLRRASRFIRKLLRSGPNLPEADLNPAHDEDEEAHHSLPVVASPPRFGVIPEPTFHYQAYPDWDGRNYRVIDEDYMAWRGETYLFTHPGGGFPYNHGSDKSRRNSTNTESPFTGTLLPAEYDNAVHDYVAAIPDEVVTQMDQERALRLNADSRLIRAA